MSRSTRFAATAVAPVALSALVVGVSLAGAAAPSAAAAASEDAAALSGADGPTADGAVAQTSDPTPRQVRGSPVLELFASQRSVPSGAESTVTVDIVNTGEMEIGNQLDSRVTTARGLTLEIDDGDAPIDG